MLDKATPVPGIVVPSNMEPAGQTPSPILTSDSTLGDSRSRPAPIGSELTIVANDFFSNYEARIVLLEVVRGEAASKLIAGASEFNSYLGKLDPGFEYALARIRFDYLMGADHDTAYHLNSSEFTAVSSNGKEYDRAFVVGLDPDLSADLYPGASHEGWTAFQVAKTDTAPLLTFGRDFDGRGGLWWKLSESSALKLASFSTTKTSTPTPTLVPQRKFFEGRMGQITKAFFLKEGKVTFATTYRGGQGSALTVYLQRRNGDDVELIAYGRVLYSSTKVVNIDKPGYYILDIEAGDGVWSIEVE
jgi:hypothetical protein